MKTIKVIQKNASIQQSFLKVILFCAITAFTLTSFGQNKQFLPDRAHSPSNSLDNIQRHRDGKQKTPGTSFDEYFRLDANQSDHGQSLVIQIVDSIYTWQWDTISNAWINDTRAIDMVHDLNNNTVSYIVQHWSISVWENSVKYIFAYDSSNNRINWTYKNWSGSDWVNASQTNYTYDGNNNLINDVKQTWNGSVWVNFFQSLYTYDAGNNMTVSLSQFWDNGAWANSIKFSYTYDAHNNELTSLREDWNGTSWVTKTQTASTYDINKNLTHYLSQNWLAGAWVNANQRTYTYDVNNNMISQLRQVWTGTAWINYLQIIYTYDHNNNVLSASNQTWNGGAWISYQQSAYTYDANNFRKSYAYKYWDNGSATVTGGDSAYYYFHTILGIEDMTSFGEQINVYPNPGNGKITVSSNLDISYLEIYNILGERVHCDFTFNPKTSNAFDLSGHGKGVYLVKIYYGTHMITRKIIVR
ncbi:MAG: T9SS type A sorting domain-containing protein [Bacteroidales bacterium]|nr:T9SS type A sorting domain-containing protein [Bacteroidales bacterium]